MNTPNAAAALFVLTVEAREDHVLIGRAILEVVDTRLTSAGYVYRVAPVGEFGPDMGSAFWPFADEITAYAA